MAKNLGKALQGIKIGVKKHSPELLMSFGIAGMITTTVLAVRATPKALNLIEKEKQLSSNQENLTPIETIKTTWKCYIPAIISGSVSVICLVSSCSVNARRNAALATAYTISESAFRDYRKKVVETIGEKKEQSVRDAVAKEKMDRNPVQNSEVIITEKGDTLCYDAISGRYFKADIDKIKKAEHTINSQIRDEMYVALNDFYYEIGLDGVKLGDMLGWNIDDYPINLDFSSQLTGNDNPCLVVDYSISPRYDYRNLL